MLRPLRMCTSAGASCTRSASVVLHEQRHGALCSCRAVRGCGSSAAVVAECCRRAYRAAALASHALSRRRGVAVARCMSRGLMPSARTIALRRVVGRAAVVAGRAYRTVALASHALSRRCGVAVVRCMSRGLVPSAWAIALRGVVGRAAVVAGWGRGGAYCAAAFVSHTLLRRRGVAAVRCMNRGREPSVHAALRRVGGCCRRACCAAALALHALSQRRGGTLHEQGRSALCSCNCAAEGVRGLGAAVVAAPGLACWLRDVTVTPIARRLRLLWRRGVAGLPPGSGGTLRYRGGTSRGFVARMGDFFARMQLKKSFSQI